jgi:fatty acid desaturase
MTPAAPMSGPIEANNALLRRLDHHLRRVLRLESGANIFPLAHVLCYYGFFIPVMIPKLIISLYLLVPLWVLIYLLGYSLSIGVLHMHAHRKLFTARGPNRVLEFLLCFPCVLSYPMMKYTHVYAHHKYQNGVNDPTRTRSYEHGWRAAWYWIRYAYVCQRHTIRGLFGASARGYWKSLRSQYLVDTLLTVAIMLIYLFFIDAWRMLAFWELPLILVSINIGFFAWITHAPASGDNVNGSFNTINNLMNFFIHNQGYHVVHHAHPGIHWTRIPERLDIMLEVPDRLIASYWVILPSAWRVALPRFLYDSNAGRNWKSRYVSKGEESRRRLSWMSYFGWV